MIGSLIGGSLADKFGRKKAMTINAVYAIVCLLITSSCRLVDSVWLLIIGRVLIGVNAGVNCSVAPVYIIEIAPLEKRGAFGTMFQLGVTGGSVLSQIIGLPWFMGNWDLWPVLLLLGAFMPLLQLVLIPFCPESPLWLARNGKKMEAVKAEKQLYGYSKLNLNEPKEQKVSLLTNIKQIFNNPPVYRAVVVSVMLMVIQQFCGINAIVFYSTEIFENAGIPSEYSGLCSVGLGVFKWAFLWVALALIDKAGRRPLMIWGSIGMGLMCIAATVLIGMDGEESVTMAQL